MMKSKAMICLFTAIFCASSFCGCRKSVDNASVPSAIPSANTAVSSASTAASSSGTSVEEDNCCSVHIAGYHNIDGDLIEAIGCDRFNDWVNMFGYTEDCNTAACFEYYGIPEEVYTFWFDKIIPVRQAIFADTPDYLKDVPSPQALFEGNAVESAKLFKSGYSEPKNKTVTIRDPKDAIHTNTYYTIDSALIDSIGAEKFTEFKNQFGGTENFNVLKFVNYFNLDKAAFSSITKKLPAYNPEYVYGTKEMQEKYFTKHPVDVKTVQENLNATLKEYQDSLARKTDKSN